MPDIFERLVYRETPARPRYNESRSRFPLTHPLVGRSVVKEYLFQGQRLPSRSDHRAHRQYDGYDITKKINGLTDSPKRRNAPQKVARKVADKDLSETKKKCIVWFVNEERHVVGGTVSSSFHRHKLLSLSLEKWFYLELYTENIVF